MWLGSEASYKQAQTSLAQANLSPKLDMGEDFNPGDYGLLTVSDGVGVVNIQGSMVTNAPAEASMFGVIGYNTIKDTLTYAAQDPEIKSILLNIDSGGGSASGVDSVAALIDKISSDHKPVTAFTEGTMCSAAFWIGTATDSIYATRLATVGSIGVIAVSMEYTGAMEQDGVTATVFRAGEFKALGSPYEKMDEKAAAEIQSKLDVLYKEFTTNIAEGRNLPISTAESTWAEGRTFLGFQAEKIGLVDTVTTFEDLVTGLKKKCALSDSGRMMLSTGDGMARKRVLDEKSVAIIAAGGQIPAEMGILDTVEDVAKVVEAIAEKVVEVIEDIKDDEPAVAVKSDMMDYFKAELSAANEKAMTLTLENREMKTKLESIDVTHTQLRAIAADAINLRSVGLGRGPTDLSTASDEVILSTFSNISKAFNNTFPVGGVTESASTERANSAVDDFDYEALKAARI